jgi:hypothetical protein
LSRASASSTEQKPKVLHQPGPDPQCGRSRKGAETIIEFCKENLNGGTGDDLRDEEEHFDCSPQDDAMYLNLWPDEDLPEFCNFMEECFDVCQKISLQVMEELK